MRKITKLLLCMVLVVAVACSAMTVFAQEQTTYVAENVQTGQQYADVTTAALSATEGQTVKLLQNAEAQVLTVAEDTTLDLNGYELKAAYASVFGHMVDTSEANSGVLNVGTRMLIQANNKQLPVKTDKGYKFVEIVGFNTAWMNDTTFVFQPLFEASAHEILKNGVADTDVSIQVEVTWRPFEGSEDLDSRIFKYGDNFVTQFVNSYNPATGKYGKMFTLTLVNPQNYVELACNTKVVAKSGVAFSPVKVSNAAKIGETEYATVQDALDAAQDGQTVTLLENVKATNYLDVYSASETSRSVTLDLNGKTISWGADYKYQWYPLVFVGVNQTLTIENGSIVADQHVAVGAYGHVNLISVDVSVLTASEDEQAVCIWDWSEEDKYYPDYQHNVTASGSITGGSITGGLLIEGTVELSADAGFDKLYINTETGYGKAVLPEGYGLVAENDYFVNLHAHIEETVAGKAATCTETGLTEGKKCTVCGTTTVEQEEIDALGHKEETVAGKAATCTETGLTEGKKCTVCGTTTVEQEEIDALGHKEETVAGKAATCTETGLTEGKKCTVCGTTTVEQEEIDALGHKEETVAGKAATCTATGLTDGKKCTVCGTTTVEQEEIDALGHKEETVAGKEATCTETGLTEGKKCTVCGTTTVEQEKIDALGHKEETVAGKAATCTETGLTEGKKCTVCGVTTEEQTEIPATGHTEETVAGKAATCTATGLTDGKVCTVCGVTTEEQTEIPATGHTEETVAGKAATCTETGLTDGKKCSVCGTTTVAQTEIPATGEHNYVNGTCTGCGKTELVEIDYSGTYYIAAIRSSGNYWYMTSDLGTASTKRYTAVDSGVKELPTKITSGEKDLAFTLIKQEDGTYIIMANGVESTDCYVAWGSGNSGNFAKTGRKLTVDMNDDGTFLIHFAGDEERYLSLNSTSGSNYFAFYKGTQSQMLSLIPATVCEHEWNDGEITTAATCTEQGVKTYTCVNGCTKTEPVEALGHTTNLGVCDRCGETIGKTDEPTVVLEITKGDFNTTSYAANNKTNTKNGYSYTSNQVMQQSGTMQWQKGKGYITIASNVFTKLELKTTAGTYTVTVGGKTVTGTTANGVTTYDLTGLTGVVKISVSNSATGKVDYIKFYK